MKNIFIRFNNRKYVSFFEKVLNLLRKIFVKISIEKLSIEKYQDTLIILIPQYNKYNLYIKKRIIKQINKLDENIPNIIFEKETQFLKKNLEINSELNAKYLMKNLIFCILEYIFNINKCNSYLENIYIFVNEYTKTNVTIIERLCKKFKTVNIITENLKCYKRLEDFFAQGNNLITVSNNKRKSARNAKYIINFDFSKEKLEQYTVGSNSVFINLTNEKKFGDKAFCGIIINDFEISLDYNYMCFVNEIYGNIDLNKYLESVILNMDLLEVENEFHKLNGSIQNLIGIRGKISQEELLHCVHS